MIDRLGLVAFFLIIQLTSSEVGAVACDGNPGIHIKPKICCRIPAFFSDTELQYCNVTETDVLDSQTCEQRKCLMKIHFLINDFNFINRKGVSDFLDNWLVQNGKWKSSIDKAKQRCFGEVIPIGDSHCVANKLFYCIIATLYEDCPSWIYEIEDCVKLRKYLDKCIYFMMHKYTVSPGYK